MSRVHVSRYVSAMSRRYMDLEKRDVVGGYVSEYVSKYVPGRQACVPA